MRKAIYEMMRWWFEKGIDGFRMDVANFYAKAEGFPDSPKPVNTPEGFVFDAEMVTNQPGIHDILKEINQETFSRYNVMSVGECHCLTSQTALDYVAYDRHELDMTFQFDVTYERSNLERRKKLIRDWYETFKGNAWNTVTLNNHDSPRQVSAFADDKEYRVRSAKMLATFVFCTPGTPYIYQGEEIGMANADFPSIDYYRDIEMLNRYRARIAQGEQPQDILNSLKPTCRDNARTPIQWDNSQNAGFTKGIPWIPVNDNFPNVNAEACLKDSDSILRYYQELIAFRKSDHALIYGDFLQVSPDDSPIYAWLRALKGSEVLVILNWSASSAEYTIAPSRISNPYRRVMGNVKSEKIVSSGNIKLEPWAALIYKSAI
jgi:oligo-1,6-glucosidase